MRRPDKPGSYRIRERDGTVTLTGVRADGRRLKLPMASRTEAERMARELFPQAGTTAPPVAATIVKDDWGIPIRVSDATIASVASAVGITKPPETTAVTPAKQEAAKKEADDKKIRQARYAKSMAEMAGIAYAAGDVMVARKWTIAAGKEPVKPDPKQVNDLADVTKETITEWFGDRDIKPWQMLIILTFGIPLSMWMQSPKAKPKSEDEQTRLKSVR